MRPPGDRRGGEGGGAERASECEGRGESDKESTTKWACITRCRGHRGRCAMVNRPSSGALMQSSKGVRGTDFECMRLDNFFT